jgi:hypothetical protein
MASADNALSDAGVLPGNEESLRDREPSLRIDE